MGGVTAFPIHNTRDTGGGEGNIGRAAMNPNREEALFALSLEKPAAERSAFL